MTKAILYILFLAYASNLIKPVLPYICDMVSHILWYQSHVSNVHFENGKYHVHLEAINAVKKTGLPVSSDNSKTETRLSDHIANFAEYDFSLRPSVQPYFPVVASSLSDLVPPADYPPPRNMHF